MCGIVGAIAERNVTPILLEGLRRLEYRGYDSAGIVTLDSRDDRLHRVRAVGKVQALAERLQQDSVRGPIGIAHTRWATHGEPCERNAHPHLSNNSVAVVHNGIIENYQELKTKLSAAGYRFESDTDTEVVAHLIDQHLRKNGGDLLASVRETVTQLAGAYSLGVLCREDPERLIAARAGSPLVLGIGIEEHFIASDVFALAPVTQSFVFLEEGDVAEVRREGFKIYDRDGQAVERPLSYSGQMGSAAGKSGYRHFMLKEIFEQPGVVAETLEGRIHQGRVLEDSFGPDTGSLFERVQGVHIIACGTSYHAGLVARYWLEHLGLPCTVEVASEYRYRQGVTPPGTLFVSISQSGETADTLAALRAAKERGYLSTLTICNVAESSLVRESALALLTRAGREIGVASTKAFTTQLVALRLLSLLLGRQRGLSESAEAALVRDLELLPRALEKALELNNAIEKLAEFFAEKHHALFLGRGPQYPIGMEGALKIKEISYIHAEAYPAGELKHGPLALVDADMPVVCVLPKDGLLEKVLSNLQEVRARGGELFLFADSEVDTHLSGVSTHVLSLGTVPESIAPIVFTVPLQLLAYHVAILKGTDVDQPRNLAKSVTVE
ncbi:MAG: glutamine--fructose-6-phosphate transaminase (isomerizing) [Candidatus Competibacteraceae bacterium]|nr:glutamine--fructose-6-phosphate transaminase (isomerizing) [Candidatus Competibacteraceae bacterium]MBK7983806.1 glutamine--fructose-6-phosphate transaminase (isomerizing) [Candidatus Competibacteraceae bacterium]MBK8897653.1 glutamine--fructose-6-phosphate transaminase (isomerizing) [Candidatus Competibacteraceae bacterium]MBK8963798.1 glutamine--fructose-6-phosphate transaminase (isomerizing) [Candidatus Competibacteraceae bacterium]MBK9950687.1 glutamine--fructose-6-phosphate transaminase